MALPAGNGAATEVALDIVNGVLAVSASVGAAASDPADSVTVTVASDVTVMVLNPQLEASSAAGVVIAAPGAAALSDAVDSVLRGKGLTIMVVGA